MFWFELCSLNCLLYINGLPFHFLLLKAFHFFFAKKAFNFTSLCSFFSIWSLCLVLARRKCEKTWEYFVKVAEYATIFLSFFLTCFLFQGSLAIFCLYYSFWYCSYDAYFNIYGLFIIWFSGAIIHVLPYSSCILCYCCLLSDLQHRKLEECFFFLSFTFHM